MGEVLTTNSGIGGAITTARLNIQPGRDHRVGIPAGDRMLYYAEAGVPASVQERGSPMLRLSGLCKRFEDLPVLLNLSLTLSGARLSP